MPFCEACGKEGADKRCSRCMESWYCSIACQTNHWKAGHKHKCVIKATEATAPTEAGGAAAAPGAGTELARAQRGVGDDECAICLDVLVQPQTMPCGHRFCHGCVTSMQEYGASDTQVCPLCRSAMPDIERATWTACYLLTQWDRWLKSAPHGTPMPAWVLKSVTKAAEFCREALVIDPANERARYSLGCALDAAGDVAGAEIAYGAATTGVSPQTAAMAHCMLGVIRADRGDAAGAEAAFRAGAAADPQHAKAHANLGTQLIRRGDKAGAEAAYRAAVALDPQHEQAQCNLGILLDQGGDKVGAENCYRATIAANPRYGGAHFNLGVLLDSCGDLAGAEAAYTDATDVDPRDSDAYCNLGELLVRRGDKAGAADAYTAAINADPSCVEACVAMGTLMKQRGDMAGAEAVYRAAIIADPQCTEAHENLAALGWDGAGGADGSNVPAAVANKGAVGSGKKKGGGGGTKKKKGKKGKKAKDILLRSRGVAQNSLGILLRQRGDKTGAEAAFRAAVALDPEEAGAFFALGQLLEERGDFAGAEVAYRGAIAAEPDFIQPRVYLASLLHNRGDLAGAEASYRAAIAIDPQHLQAHLNLACVQGESGNLAGAARSSAAALRIDPSDIEAKTNLAKALRHLKEQRNSESVHMPEAALEPGAEAAFRARIAADPQDAGAHFHLGVLLSHRGDLALAEDAYRAAIAADPQHAKAHCNLGYIYFCHHNDFIRAEVSYHTAITIDPQQAIAHFNMGLVMNEFQRQAEGADRDELVARSIAAFRAAVAADPQHAKAHFHLGVLLDTKETANRLCDRVNPIAEAEYRTSIALDPQFACAHYNLGILLHNKGDLAGSRRSLTTALQIDPSDSQTQYTLRKVIEKQGAAGGAAVAADEGDTRAQLEATLSRMSKADMLEFMAHKSIPHDAAVSEKELRAVLTKALNKGSKEEAESGEATAPDPE